MLHSLRQFLAPPVFKNEDETRAAHLLNIITLASLSLIAFAVPVGLVLARQTIDARTAILRFMLPMAVPALAQILLRQKRVRLASIFYLLAAWTSLTLNVFASGGVRAPAFANYTVVVVAAGLLLGSRPALGVAGLSLVTGGVAFYLERQGYLPPPATSDPASHLVGLSVGFLITAVLLRLFVRNLNEMVKRLRESNQELQAVRLSLEENIAARTHGLALAAEISHSISQVRDLDSLLSEAIELIRSRFDLYYAQIYLTDPTGRTLVLRSGTGSTGAELLRRGHRLLVGPGSLNGRAAAERQAVVVSDVAASTSFRPNPLLPLTRSEMVMPLVMEDQVVGVLDLQHSQPDAFTAEALPAFEAVAGQLAVAIRNAALFTQAEQARLEVEAQAHRLAQAGWADFLNAVERNERFGYAFDANGLTPVEAAATPAPDQPTLSAPILVSGEPVGLIQLEGNVDQSWTDDEAEVVNAVARQVAQQVENLRLLAQAEQARAEVEAQARRLTREGWEDYLQTASPSAGGYTYDLNQVSPLTAGADSSSPEIVQPLTVRGERIGEIEVEGVEGLDGASAELVATVAGQLSAHLENLRLAGQTRTALVDLAQRERVVSNVADTAVELLQRGPTAISDVLARLGKDAGVSRVYIFENFIDHDGLLCIRQTHEWAAEGIAPQIDNPELQHLPYATTLPRWPDILSRGGLIRSLVRDLPATERELMESQDIRSLLIIPMFAGKEFYGFVGFDDCARERAWDAYEINLLQTVSISIVNAIMNARLLQQTEDALTQTRRRADREALVNEISQKIQSTLTVEGAMQTAIQELGRALRARRTAVELGAFARAGNGE